jgi:hypothetical protein
MGGTDVSVFAALRKYSHLSDKVSNSDSCLLNLGNSTNTSSISLLVMAQRLGVSEVVSFDPHIRQMARLGIVCVP